MHDLWIMKEHFIPLRNFRQQSLLHTRPRNVKVTMHLQIMCFILFIAKLHSSIVTNPSLASTIRMSKSKVKALSSLREISMLNEKINLNPLTDYQFCPAGYDSWDKLILWTDSLPQIDFFQQSFIGIQNQAGVFSVSHASWISKF